MSKKTFYSLAMLVCSGLSAVSAADLPEKVKALNQFREFRLAQGQIYEILVKSGDGVTTVTFPSAISKIAGINVAVDGSRDFIISAKPGSYYFNLAARKKGATGTLTVIHNRQTYILYLRQDDKRAYASVNFAAGSGSPSFNRGKSVSPARLLSLIDLAKGYDLMKQRYPHELRDTVRAENHRIFKFERFRIELLEVVRFNREDTLVFKLLLHNDTAEEIAYDKFTFSVQAGNTTYYMSAADASGIMPPKSASWAFFAITGTPDGGRNNLAPDNDFLVGVTAKYMDDAFNIEEKQPDPVTQRLTALAEKLEKKIAELEKQQHSKPQSEIKDEKKKLQAPQEPTAKTSPSGPPQASGGPVPADVSAEKSAPPKMEKTSEKIEPPVKKPEPRTAESLPTEEELPEEPNPEWECRCPEIPEECSPEADSETQIPEFERKIEENPLIFSLKPELTSEKPEPEPNKEDESREEELPDKSNQEPDYPEENQDPPDQEPDCSEEEKPESGCEDGGMENPIPAGKQALPDPPVSEPEKRSPASAGKMPLGNPVLDFPFHNPAWLPENPLFPVTQFNPCYFVDGGGVQ